MTHNMPDDVHLTTNDPCSPVYDDGLTLDQRRVREDMELDRRNQMIECVVGGYSETDDGDEVPLERFAEYVLECADSGDGAMADECYRLALWTLQDGDSNSDVVRKLRRDVAYHFVMMEENL